jgi:hypothetical protein
MTDTTTIKILETVHKKEIDVDALVKPAVKESRVLQELLIGQKSKDETFRYNCFKILYKISENHPSVLYSEWNYFVELLSSENSYHRMAAVQILANLTQADKEDKFKTIFDVFFNLLNDRSMIVAIYTAQNGGKIAKWNPDLRSKITEKLFDIDKTHHEQDRKDLIKAGAIESFEDYFQFYENKDKIIAFVKKCTDCKSPKTRKIAKLFLDKYLHSI